ncbi:RNA-directed DNA polymerase, eukaryota, Reverse transcriptase zinc-binding domain protein [Artemisia annua]|uniref:RNA-directed DNA polymerase, eukaryota, Reverse transcriptase zinc-binding domain protein n=1 Tax=Artemisia annua TaxID=35608 RepID=A0A2U1LV02_ARTAN|nr:RNA-directed DNA polymerase, eukaryota, Reverse transcriptase zinc-binding domain protein [Artemisia annua]
MKCIFCKRVKDSHDHLFFGCELPGKVWNRMKNLVKLNTAPNCWSEILDFMLRRPINKSIWSILQRLVIGASIYYIWQERNLRLFQGKVRSIDEICYMIQDVVRLRILGLNITDSDQVLEAAKVWDFHVEREKVIVLLPFGLVLGISVAIILLGLWTGGSFLTRLMLMVWNLMIRDGPRSVMIMPARNRG